MKKQDLNPTQSVPETAYMSEDPTMGPKGIHRENPDPTSNPPFEPHNFHFSQLSRFIHFGGWEAKRGSAGKQLLRTTNSFHERMNYGLDNFTYSYLDFGFQKQTCSLISNMSASVARGRGRDEEKYERGIGHMGNMGPQRDMGEELGSKGGRDNDDHDHHPTSPSPCNQEQNTS